MSLYMFSYFSNFVLQKLLETKSLELSFISLFQVENVIVLCTCISHQVKSILIFTSCNQYGVEDLQYFSFLTPTVVFTWLVEVEFLL